LKVGLGTKIYEPVVILDDEKHEVIIGKNCIIGQFAFIAARKLVMEDGVEICAHAILSGGGNITLGKYSTVTFGAKLIPSTFSTEGKYMNDNVPEKSKAIRGSITLGEGAYIGAGAVVCVSEKCPHIKIGDYAVVGALTYLDHSLPAHTIIHNKGTKKR